MEVATLWRFLRLFETTPDFSRIATRQTAVPILIAAPANGFLLWTRLSDFFCLIGAGEHNLLTTSVAGEMCSIRSIVEDLSRAKLSKCH